MRWFDIGRVIMVSAVGCGLTACVSSSALQEQTGTTSLGVKFAEVDEQTLIEARQLFDAGNSGLALVRIQAYLAANPGSVSGQNLAGAIFDSIGRYDLAQRHYEKALAQQSDYLPAVNNFGLSMLQRARAADRLDLEQEADVLLARALELSGDPAQLAKSHEALRAALAPRAPSVAAAPIIPRRQPTVWLERRGESYSYLVTKPSPSWATLTELDLDPSMALVSSGATYKTMRIAIVPSRARRLRMWTSVGDAAPRLFGATTGLSILTLKAPKKPSWYSTFVSFPADAAHSARVAFLKFARLP